MSTWLPLHMFRTRSSIDKRSWDSHDLLFLNPCCWSDKKLFSSGWFVISLDIIFAQLTTTWCQRYILVCSLIGSPFLNTGDTIAACHWFGTIPAQIEGWNQVAKGALRDSANSLRTFAYIFHPDWGLCELVGCMPSFTTRSGIPWCTLPRARTNLFRQTTWYYEI
jgi:hypothetical protein